MVGHNFRDCIRSGTHFGVIYEQSLTDEWILMYFFCPDGEVLFT